jgi:5-formyltetrahydrofolate cyclo-ligase
MTADQARARLREQADELRRMVEAKDRQREQERTNPPAYLMTTAGQWRVIVQGIPLTADKPTQDNARAAAERLGAVIAPHYWDADRQQWHTIEELTT